jgi:hypothetical protein
VVWEVVFVKGVNKLTKDNERRREVNRKTTILVSKRAMQFSNEEREAANDDGMA